VLRLVSSDDFVAWPPHVQACCTLARAISVNTSLKQTILHDPDGLQTIFDATRVGEDAGAADGSAPTSIPIPSESQREQARAAALAAGMEEQKYACL
jgi:hypothetical protein